MRLFKNVKMVVCCLLFALLGCTCVVQAQDFVSVRVAILNDVNDVLISVRGGFTVVNEKTQEEILAGRTLNRTSIRIEDKNILWGRTQTNAAHVSVTLSKDMSILIGNKLKRFRGRVDFIVDEKNQLMLVNHIDIERYIKGVLYHETSHKWPMEALKTQAVAARTYALYRKKVTRDQPFDVTSNIYSQVYGGRSAERYRTNLAVERTEGEILMYAGEILPTYFSSNCAGHTEDVRNLWKHDLIPLRGVKCPYCANAPLNQWKRNFQLSDVQKKLNAGGKKIGAIKAIEIEEKNQSGRITTLKIIQRDGNVTRISGKDFRQLVGPNDLKSNKYDITMQGYFFDVHGQGWGHGVGMCQWGAFHMAKKRFKYDDILAFYYPQSEIKKLEKLKPY